MLYINASPNRTMAAPLPLARLGAHGGGKMRVRDIWARRDVGETAADSFTPPPVPPRDSGFYLLSPSE